MEETVRCIAESTSMMVGIIAINVSALAFLHLLFPFIWPHFHKQTNEINVWMRVRPGSSLAVALVLLQVADIVAAAAAPTWDEIGLLAAIAAIRTGLNYCLKRELKEMEKHIPMDPHLNAN